MRTMRLTGSESYLELTLVRWDGDAYVAVVVDSRGFRGRNDLHVLGKDFRRFCADLVTIQKTLKGKARIAGVHEDELDISIEPSDSLGHFSITGTTGYHVPNAHGAYWHSVTFGFEIEPAQLDGAVKTSWVRENAP